DNDAFLQAHNEKRCIHGSPPLTWSDTVAATAQAYATELSQDGCGSLSLQFLTAALLSSPLSLSIQVVDQWYDEPKTGALNHFTQVVWSATTEVGCGDATCGGSTYVVCNYNPAGNRVGEFAENV
ncbi:unnamed protein product, partial [Chrysoparadoxa australica]